MTTYKTRWLLVGLVCLALWPSCAVDEGPTWEAQMAAGNKVFERGDYPEAERQLEPALRKAEGFAPSDPRLAMSLDNLATVYHAQGRYAEAEPLFKRALAIWEKVLGPDHPNVATSLENYAALLRETGRSTEAAKLMIWIMRSRLATVPGNPRNSAGTEVFRSHNGVRMC